MDDWLWLSAAIGIVAIPLGLGVIGKLTGDKQ